MSSKKVFRWIKVGGLLSLIPIVLAAGPLTGYLAADFLVKKLNFPGWTSIVCVIIGFVASAQEVVRIVKAALIASKEHE